MIQGETYLIQHFTFTDKSDYMRIYKVTPVIEENLESSRIGAAQPLHQNLIKEVARAKNKNDEWHNESKKSLFYISQRRLGVKRREDKKCGDEYQKRHQVNIHRHDKVLIDPR